MSSQMTEDGMASKEKGHEHRQGHSGQPEYHPEQHHTRQQVPRGESGERALVPSPARVQEQPRVLASIVAGPADDPMEGVIMARKAEEKRGNTGAR